jgi:acetyl esterase
MTKADAALHPEVIAVMGNLGAVSSFPEEVLNDPTAAERYLAVARGSIGREIDRVEPVADVHDAQLPSGRAVRVYVPMGVGPLPVILFFHGGGWVVGNLEMNDELCRRLANRAGTVVVSLDYRLAPEAPFPAALEDGREALRWIKAEAATFGGDANAIAVGGTSAGGNLAAGLALSCRDAGDPAIALQVLMYPVLDSRMATRSFSQFGQGPVLEARQMRWYWDQYAPDPSARGNPFASPAHATDLGSLPPAIIVIAECDPLSDEAEEYAVRLAAAGVMVHRLHYPGQVHSFLRHFETLTDADRAVNTMAELIRKTLQATQ